MTSSANSEAGRVLPAPETGSSRFYFWLQTALAGGVFGVTEAFSYLMPIPLFHWHRAPSAMIFA